MLPINTTFTQAELMLLFWSAVHWMIVLEIATVAIVVDETICKLQLNKYKCILVYLFNLFGVLHQAVLIVPYQ